MPLRLETYANNASAAWERDVIDQTARITRESFTLGLTNLARELRRQLGVTPKGNIKVVRPRIRGRRTRLHVYTKHPIRKNPWLIMAAVYFYEKK